jgi:hypothetical protein
MAGVLLLVTFPPPVEEDTEGACVGDFALPRGVNCCFCALAARGLVELVEVRFSLDSLIWLVLARGVRRDEDEVRLEGLLGVLGYAKSSSWKPLNLESYDLCVPAVELRIPLLVRVGVEGEL